MEFVVKKNRHSLNLTSGAALDALKANQDGRHRAALVKSKKWLSITRKRKKKGRCPITKRPVEMPGGSTERKKNSMKGISPVNAVKCFFFAGSNIRFLQTLIYTCGY